MRTKSKNDKNNFVGKWRIVEMDVWDTEYIDMEVPAFLAIKPDGSGSFQFGLVQGEIDGEMVEYPSGKRFEFTWEGEDEGEPMSGSGWLEVKNTREAIGTIRIHRGDVSGFVARKT